MVDVAQMAAAALGDARSAPPAEDAFTLVDGMGAARGVHSWSGRGSLHSHGEACFIGTYYKGRRRRLDKAAIARAADPRGAARTLRTNAPL